MADVPHELQRCYAVRVLVHGVDRTDARLARPTRPHDELDQSILGMSRPRHKCRQGRTGEMDAPQGPQRRE